MSRDARCSQYKAGEAFLGKAKAKAKAPPAGKKGAPAAASRPAGRGAKAAAPAGRRGASTRGGAKTVASPRGASGKAKASQAKASPRGTAAAKSKATSPAGKAAGKAAGNLKAGKAKAAPAAAAAESPKKEAQIDLAACRASNGKEAAARLGLAEVLKELIEEDAGGDKTVRRRPSLLLARAAGRRQLTGRARAGVVTFAGGSGGQGNAHCAVQGDHRSRQGANRRLHRLL